jgi:hypothetical protein
LSRKLTYPCVIESESKEWELKVEVLVDLRSGGVNVSLVVADILVTSLVVEPVEEVRPNLREPLGRDDVWLSIVLVGGCGQHSAINVS